MTQEIDFLKTKRGASLKQLKQKRFLKTGSLVFLICYCLIAGGIFAFWLYLNQTNQQVEKQIAFQKQKVVQLEKIESLQILFKQRLSSLVKVFSQQPPDYEQIILFFNQIAFDGLVFNEFKLTNEGKMAVTGTAANAVLLSNFLEAFKKAPETQNYFSEISLDSTNRQSAGDYDFSLTLKTK